MKLSVLSIDIIAATSEAFALECHQRGFGCAQSVKSYRAVFFWPGHDAPIEAFNFLTHCQGMTNEDIESCMAVEEGKLL